MSGGSNPDLRLDPDVLPRVMAAYEKAAIRIGAILVDVQNRGRVTVPWTQDAVSVAMADHYNEQIFGVGPTPSPYSTFGALSAYRDELLNVRDTLKQIHDDYLRAEAEAATGFNRL